MKTHVLLIDSLDAPDYGAVRAALPDDPTMAMIVRIFQALADPTRGKIILALTRQELCVSDIATIVGASVSSVSHHLKGLRDIRLVKHRREGTTIFYSIDDAHVGNLFREALAHLDHVYRNLPDHSMLREPPVASALDTRKELYETL